MIGVATGRASTSLMFMATPGLIATKRGKKNVQFKLLGGSTTLKNFHLTY
jgi:hypothetical protein